MEINSINLPLLHNEEHFQFNKEVKELIELNGAKTLNIESDFNAYLPCIAQEEEALNLIRKSATTRQIEDADDDRDDIIRGLTKAVESQLKHFNAANREAASRFRILLDQYGDMANKPYDDETAAIHKFVLEALGKYAADAKTIHITEWITVLNTKNLFFQSLKKDRNSEEAQKTVRRMKTERVAVDNAYKKIVKRVNALITINGEAGFEVFVNELNSRIDKMNNTLAQRKGRSKKNGAANKKQDSTNSPEITEG